MSSEKESKKPFPFGLLALLTPIFLFVVVCPLIGYFYRDFYEFGVLLPPIAFFCIYTFVLILVIIMGIQGIKTGIKRQKTLSIIGLILIGIPIMMLIMILIWSLLLVNFIVPKLLNGFV